MVRFWAIIFAVLFISTPREANAGSGPLRYVATIPPLAMILDELTTGRAEVYCLLPPGASEHTYEPRPSDAKIAAEAPALFYVSSRLDQWAAVLPARQKIAVFDLLPTSDRLSLDPAIWGGAAQDKNHEENGHIHDHAGNDPHFWTNPLTVRALLPPLAAQLAKLDPEGGSIYTANAGRFAKLLEQLDAEIAAQLEPVRSRAVFLFHPSLGYLLHRYGLPIAGIIEPFPGSEPSPRYLAELIQKVHDTSAKAIFSEPQLPRAPAEVISKTTGLRLYELDPVGGTPGRETLPALIRYNAHTLAEALR